MHEPTPSPQPRLSGEKLQRWYAHNDDSPEARERRRRELERTAFQFSLVYLLGLQLFVFALGSPVFGALQASMLGFWFILGRGEFWVRLSVVGGLMLLLGSWIAPQFEDIGSRLLLVVALILAAGLTYLLGILLSRILPFARRPVQFSLWEIGGCILGCALAFSYARYFRNAEEFAADVEALWESFGKWVLPLVLNAVVACLPVVLPRAGRKLWHFGLAVLLAWIVLPFVHAPLVVTGWGNRRFLELLAIVWFVGPTFAWVTVFPVEGMGLFLEPTMQKTKQAAEPEPDPLGIE